MSTITAGDVKRLRDRTGLPMMDCKKALSEAAGDEDKAIELLRKAGRAVAEKRGDRETAFGRFGIHTGTDKSVGAIVELQCESAPVTQNEEFIQLANDLATQLATGPGANSADELLDQASPSKDGMTLRKQKEDLFNRIREIFKVGRIKRFDSGTGGYSHNGATISGVLIAVEGNDDEAAKDISMHIAAMSPKALNVEDLNPADVDKEREILREAALQEGKPESIVDKMVEGRLKSYFAERVLLEQAFVKSDKQSVGEFAKSKGINITDYVHWELGDSSD